MIIAIGTKNLAKNAGFKTVASQIWTDAKYVSLDTNSQVSNQPLTLEETILGAKNRAYAALEKVPKATLGVGMEGGIFTNYFGTFLGGWVVIVDRTDVIGVGSSAFIKLPSSLSDRIISGEELGPIIQEKMNDEKNNIRHSEGTAGILTKGLYVRSQEFADATKCAIAPFISKEFYSENYFKK